jgi:hypothetical protein
MTEGELYTDAETGITLKTWTAADPAKYTFGLALPANALETDATEYIGILVGLNAIHHLGTLAYSSSAAHAMPRRPATAVSPTACPAA